MTAPALVMIAQGSVDPRVAQVTQHIRAGLARLRPELSVHAAFLGSCPPAPHQVMSRITASGAAEVVLVPLGLANAIEADPPIGVLLESCREAFPGTSFVASRPVGPELSLLPILDERLRTALAAARILELDGLVLSSASAGDVRGSALLARRARQWSTHHRLPCLTAVADGSGPSVTQALQGLRSQGRRHIAVGSFFLTADEHFHAQAEHAFRGGAVAVSEPIGPAREVMDLVLARYAFAAMELLDFAQPSLAYADDFEGEDAWASA